MRRALVGQNTTVSGKRRAGSVRNENSLLNGHRRREERQLRRIHSWPPAHLAKNHCMGVAEGLVLETFRLKG